MANEEYDVIVVGGGNAAFCAALAAREQCSGCSCWSARRRRKRAAIPVSPRARCASSTTASTTCGGSCPTLPMTKWRLPTSALTRSSSFSTTWGASRNTGAIPTSRSSWSSAAAKRCCGCGARACVSRRSMAARRSRSTGGSSSGAGSRSRPGAGAKGWWMRSPNRASAMVSRSGTVRRAVALLHDDDGVHGVRVRRNGHTIEVRAKAVVLAGGGFQANPEWRCRYLGPGWELAKVRGTRFNTGDVIRMALDAGAAPFGNWSGCHAVGWERNAPEFGDLAVGDAVPEAQLSIGHHDQRRRQALRRRRCGLPQLHVCEVRPRDPEPARAVRLADLRQEGDAPAARRVPHQAGDQGDCHTIEELASKLDGVERRPPLAELKPTMPRSRSTSPSTRPSRTAAARAALPSTSRTGPIASTSRRSKRTRSPAASRSRSAGCASPQMHR